MSLGFHAMSHLVYLLPVAERNSITLPTYFQLLIVSLSLLLHLVISHPQDRPGHHRLLISFFFTVSKGVFF